LKKNNSSNGNKSRGQGNKKGKKDVDGGDEGFQKKTAEEDSPIIFSGKKKGKKSNKGGQKKTDEEETEYSVPEANEEDEDVKVVLSGKKKAKVKNNKPMFTNSAFDAVLTDEEDIGDKSVEDNIEVKEMHQKEGDAMESDVEEAIQFTGKKKGKKNKKADADAIVLMSDDTQKQEKHGVSGGVSVRAINPFSSDIESLLFLLRGERAARGGD